MRDHFEDWEITGYEDLIPALKCEEADRHVLAAAIRGAASQIVTFNTKHFANEALEPYGIEAIPPDEFFLNALHMYPKDTAEVILQQVAALRRPQLSVDNVLATLAKCGAPQFAREVENIIAAMS